MNISILCFTLCLFCATPNQNTELSKEAQQLSDLLAKLENQPASKSLQFRYLHQFPGTAEDFKRLFDPADFSELYDGHKYISLLKDLINDYPWQVGCILVNVSKGTKWNVDAPNYLQEITAFFALNRVSPFVQILKTYDVPEQDQVISFLADGFHSPVKGYSEIVDQLQKIGEVSLAARFVKIEQKMASSRDHDAK